MKFGLRPSWKKLASVHTCAGDVFFSKKGHARISLLLVTKLQSLQEQPQKVLTLSLSEEQTGSHPAADTRLAYRFRKANSKEEKHPISA